MIISKELAQKIVDHLMNIVHRNVNIMDCNGIIIASGQSTRINTFHQGGQSAVRTQNVIEIQPKEIKQYTGALPGVMWPINIKGKIVGVVGVTGKPREVRNTAQLIKSVTELVLEREMFLADYRSENRVKEQLIDLLFSDNPSQEDIRTLSEMLNYKINLPRIVILIHLEPINKDDFSTNGLQNLFSARVRENVLNLIKDAPFFNPEDISLFYKKHLCIIKFLPESCAAKKLNTFITSIMMMLNSLQPKLKIKIGIGSRALHTSHLRLSYREALFALEHSDSNSVHSIHEYEVLLNYLMEKQCSKCDSSLALKELKVKFDEIKDIYDLENTLTCLLKNNINVSATASQLYIHRNTLKFRLGKLKQLIGLDPCHFFQHAMICQFLLCMDKRDLC